MPQAANSACGMEMIMAQIICNDLALGYDGKRIAENINFTVQAGGGVWGGGGGVVLNN